MTEKPLIGVVFLTSGWFRDVGLQNENSDLSREVDKMAAEIIHKLSGYCTPVHSGVVYSTDEAKKLAEKIKTHHVDGLIVAPLMWCEDQILRAFLKDFFNAGTRSIPILLSTFFPYEELPYYKSSSIANKNYGKSNLKKAILPFQKMLKGSGGVGSLQFSGMLKREGYIFRSETGYFRDEDLYKRIGVHLKAMKIKSELQNTKCGILPYRCDQMSTTYIDEFKLRSTFGIELTYLTLEEVRYEAEKVKSEEISVLKEKLSEHGINIHVGEKNFTHAARYSIALERIIERHGLSIIAMNDVGEEMHICFGIRPSLFNPAINERGTVISMEADVAAGICMYITKLLTGSAPFYTETFTSDLKNNAILMGHAGYHDPSIHDPNVPVRIIPDVEYENSDPYPGAYTYFKYKNGNVTVINSVYDGENLRWIVVQGESIGNGPILEGNSHLLFKPSIPVKYFFNSSIELGSSQHWIVLPGHLSDDIERLCFWLGIKYVKLE